eukprot:6880905-Prymnesium_polylepis.1
MTASWRLSIFITRRAGAMALTNVISAVSADEEEAGARDFIAGSTHSLISLSARSLFFWKLLRTEARAASPSTAPAKKSV